MISADAVFASLFAGGYVKPFEWKKNPPQCAPYNVPFFCEKCHPQCRHIFEVHIKNGEHLIAFSAVAFFCKRHNIPMP